MEFRMERAQLNVTMRCNFQCRLCANYIPYYTSDDWKDDHIEEAIHKFFSAVSHVQKLVITGGEPLLYPKLNSLLHVLQLYSSHIASLQIITNGSIGLNEEILASINMFGREKVNFLIDDYGSTLSKKVNDLNSVLTHYGVAHVVRNYTEIDPYCGGWVYFGDLTEQKLHTIQDREALFEKCTCPQNLNLCMNIMPDGLMYPCNHLRRCKELGVVNNPQEYIDLLDESLTIEELRDKINKVYKMKSFEACAYCNGIHADSTRYMPAEQLTVMELECVRSGVRSYAEIQSILNLK